MKKTYMMPAQQVREAETQTMMAFSLQDGNANPNAEVLTKEDEAWSVWDGDEE